MSWIERCYQTYEYIRNNSPDMIGAQEPVPLLPIAHTTQQVNIQVELSLAGEFMRAILLQSPTERTTIIPCTEESSARTSGAAPHPLVDKLQYIAADYKEYGGAKESSWDAYHRQLRAWCESRYSHPYVCVVLKYLEQGHLIRDLVSQGILFVDANHRLPTKYKGDKEPAIIRTLTGGDQTESFVRFRVGNCNLHEDSTVRDSYYRYYADSLQSRGVCLVTGQDTSISTLSPYKIRNPGDRAKLISANDSANYTYRGRFLKPLQAMSVSYRVTQEAHSALRWLISRQGTQCGDLTFLVWGTRNEALPALGEDTFDIAQNTEGMTVQDDLDDLGEFDSEMESVSTMEIIARQFNAAIHGYSKRLTDSSQVAVIGLDSATPGRMSIRYYQELSGSRLLNNIVDWHQTTAWLMEYRKVEVAKQSGKRTMSRLVTFYGAPSPVDIAKAAYGDNVDQKLKQQTMERLVPCIVDRKSIPRDLVLSTVQRATRAVTLEPWDARRTRGIACALLCGYYNRTKGMNYSMALDSNNSDRSYLYGRILACAEQVERYALNIGGDDKRTTNAERMQVVFTQRPGRTTRILQQKLQPYLNRIQTQNGSRRRYDLMLELIDRLGAAGYTDKPLGDLYLLGYSSQIMEFKRENEIYKQKNDGQ